MSSLQNSKHISYFLIHEFFSVVKEMEPHFSKFESPEALISNLSKKDLDKQLKCVRFCTLALELHNCATRFYETFLDKSTPEPNPYTKLFLSSYFTKEEFDTFIKKFTLEIVFTAHPTEVFPLSVLKNLNRIEVLLEKYFAAKSPERTYRYLQGLRANLTSLWLTDEMYRTKPSPEEEADRLLYVFESSLWKASPSFFRKFYWDYKKRFKASPKDYPNLKFSSWIGGDRDGNPFVTAKSTYRIITKSRRKILRLILLQLYPLRDETLIKSTQKSLLKRYPKETFPYRSLFQDLIDTIQNVLAKHKTDDVQELRDHLVSELRFAYECLCKDGAKRVADRRLRSLLDRIKTFSLSPFKLDLRQDSEVHANIISELQKHTGKKKLSIEEAKKVPFHKLSPESKEFFNTLSVIKGFTPTAVNCYIISMTRSVADIENLKFLLELGGLKSLPIVPLFETPDDLRNSEKIIAGCKKKNIELNQVMWGYSDSTKKGGRLASAWNVYKAQKRAHEMNPNLVHFHGRGGSIARGGGDTESYFSLLPAQTVGHHFRQTFQGEVIQDEFGLPIRTLHSLETLIKESVLNYFSPKPLPSQKIKEKLDFLSDTSEKKFFDKFYHDENFSKAFALSSPISIINEMNLGSRPSKRVSNYLGVSYRAIPWVFSWAQTRGHLPIWYGLQKLEKELLSLKKDSYFVRNFLNLISTGLKNSDESIFKMYFSAEPDFKKIADELTQIKTAFLGPPLSDELSLTEPLVNYLHSVQITHLKNKKPSKLELDIERICAQGIASYLGKSG